MKERPILFSRSMVRAILAGTKTQTRRIVKPTQSTPKIAPLHMEPYLVEMSDGTFEQDIDEHGLPMWIGTHPDYPSEHGKWFSCPHGQPGDRLWVRETWNCIDSGIRTQRQDWVRYRATDGEEMHWRPSIFMPRWACRFVLDLAAVRVERLQDISPSDCRAEGLRPDTELSLLWRDDVRAKYRTLWDELNAKRGYGWDSNPWVWVLTFEKVPS